METKSPSPAKPAAVKKKCLNDVWNFLQRIKMEEYYNKFINKGFDSLELLVHVKEKHLVTMKIRESDIKPLLREINKLYWLKKVPRLSHFIVVLLSILTILILPNFLPMDAEIRQKVLYYKETNNLKDISNLFSSFEKWRSNYRNFLNFNSKALTAEIIKTTHRKLDLLEERINSFSTPFPHSEVNYFKNLLSSFPKFTDENLQIKIEKLIIMREISRSLEFPINLILLKKILVQNEKSVFLDELDIFVVSLIASKCKDLKEKANTFLESSLETSLYLRDTLIELENTKITKIVNSTVSDIKELKVSTLSKVEEYLTSSEYKKIGKIIYNFQNDNLGSQIVTKIEQTITNKIVGLTKLNLFFSDASKTDFIAVKKCLRDLDNFLRKNLKFTEQFKKIKTNLLKIAKSISIKLKNSPSSCTTEEIVTFFNINEVIPHETKEFVLSFIGELTNKLMSVINSCEYDLNSNKYQQLSEDLVNLNDFQTIIKTLSNIEIRELEGEDLIIYDMKEKLFLLCKSETGSLENFKIKIKTQIEQNIARIPILWQTNQDKELSYLISTLSNVVSLYRFFPNFVKLLQMQYAMLEEEGSKYKDIIEFQIIPTLSLSGDLLEQQESRLIEINNVMEKFSSLANVLKYRSPRFNSYYLEMLSVAHKIVKQKAMIAKEIGERNTDMNSRLPDIAYSLVDLHRIGTFVQCLSNFTKSSTNEILEYYKIRNERKFLFFLGNELEQTKYSPYGKEIIQENEQFKGSLLDAFLTVVGRQNEHYAIDNLNGTDINKSKLLAAYKLYDKQYKFLFKKYLYQNTDEIVEEARRLALQTIPTKNDVIKILAHVCVVWTYKNSNLDPFYVRKNILMKPHPVQIISVFRLLEIDYEGLEFYISKLNNHLTQIKTGEGKSITLALTAIILSLYGYKVDCVCYSEYLSARDFKQFASLFKLFKVYDLISYGTIKQLSEKFVNDRIDMRVYVELLIRNKLMNYLPLQKKLPKSVLLIDEVDVFFSENFIGHSYDPSALVSSPNIVKLIEQIWKFNFTFQEIEKIEIYQEIKKEFKGYEFIFDTEVKKMLYDKKDIFNPPYFVHNGKIAYTEFDGISLTDCGVGYKTQFAYIKESEEGKIVQSEKIKNLGFKLLCGKFSYAEIPKKFSRVMGVTGTLENLSVTQKQILSSYKINKFSFMPSIFGKSKFHFNEFEHFQVEKNEKKKHLILSKEIEKNIESERAVLVFFEDEQKLLSFKNSEKFKAFSYKNELTQKTDNKEAAIRKSTRSKHVNLLTREFGRGIDFICNDETVLKNNGVHVIQTFVSKDIAEEIQIKGRTARQGQPGSFQMILEVKDVTKFGISHENVTNIMNSGSNLYKQLFEIRNSLFEQECLLLKDKIGYIIESDAVSNQLQDILYNFEPSLQEEAFDLLKQLISSNSNQRKDYHIIFVIDASSSMSYSMCGNNSQSLFFNKGNRWTSLLVAFNSFIHKRRISNARDIVTIIEFADTAHISCIAQPLSNNLDKFLLLLGGNANFSHSISSAKQILDTNRHDIYTPLLFFISDSESSDGEQEMQDLIEEHSKNGLIVRILSFCESRARKLRKIAEIGKGKFKEATNDVELSNIFNSIALELEEGI